MVIDYPRRIRFYCLRCGLCCGDTESRERRILLLEIEAERISMATSKPIEAFAERIEDFEPYVYLMRKAADERKCVFLKDDQCTIYLLRPIVCRFYPFELKPPEKGKHKFRYTEECPGIGKGEVLKRGYFEGLLQQLDRLQMGKASGQGRVSK